MTWTEKGVCLGEGRVFKEKDGSPVAFCARTALIKALDAAKKLGLTFTLGFEIKFVLMKRGEKGEFEPLDNDGHAWSAGRAMDHEAATTVVEKTVLALEDAGVYVGMVHLESARAGSTRLYCPKRRPSRPWTRSSTRETCFPPTPRRRATE